MVVYTLHLAVPLRYHPRHNSITPRGSPFHSNTHLESTTIHPSNTSDTSLKVHGNKSSKPRFLRILPHFGIFDPHAAARDVGSGFASCLVHFDKPSSSCTCSATKGKPPDPPSLGPSMVTNLPGPNVVAPGICALALPSQISSPSRRRGVCEFRWRAAVRAALRGRALPSEDVVSLLLQTSRLR